MMSTQSEIELHGHRVCFRHAGEGPLIVLIHGITGRSDQWEPVIEHLAAEHTVLAPDLLGHGESAKPRGDYSLGAYASAVRDTMVALGRDRATIVGHSLGGGIAMQFAYQFPERCERLVLVSSGGLGREVHPLLRGATLPGSELVLPLLTHGRVLAVGEAIGRAIGFLRLQAGTDLAEIARGFGSLGDAEARSAFIESMRAVLDPGGQRVSALDRLYLADQMPTMFIWGSDDPVIPVDHGRRAHEVVPNSFYVEIAGSGHWPMLDAPNRIVHELVSFLEETEPFEYDLEQVRKRLQRGPRR